MNNICLALPEIFIALAGFLLLLLSAERGEKGLSLVGALTALSFVVGAFLVGTLPESGLAFSDMFIVDGLARFSKILLLIVAALSLFLAPSYLKDTKSAKPEYAVLLLFAALGMMIMISAHDLMSLYVGLELQNLALYVLVSFQRDSKKSSEAGLKYFILGSVSSAILLLGISFLYGATGGTGFEVLKTGSGAGFALGTAFVLAGFAFKIAAVPFHVWAPDVYEGAPTPVTAFLLAAPKIAGLVLLARVLAGPLASAHEIWQPILIFFAVASMVLGAFGGLAQTNLKRLMAYSAITNSGVMLIGLALLNQPQAAVAGFAGTLLYLALYFMGTFGLFAGLLLVRCKGMPVEKVKDLSGLFKTHPTLGACMAALLFSLAGIPPLAGFFGKYNVLLAAVKGDAIWLAVVGVLASVVAAAYYLRVIKVMVFDPPPTQALEVVSDKTLHALALLAAAAVVLFVVMPAPLMNGAQEASISLLP